METCPTCRGPLEVIDYVAVTLFDESIHTVVRFCLSCGYSDRADTHLETAGVGV